MNSAAGRPARRRRRHARTTFQNSAQVLSIGVFFTLMIVGLAATLPHALELGAWSGAACRPRRRTQVRAAVPAVFGASSGLFLGWSRTRTLLIRRPARAVRPSCPSAHAGREMPRRHSFFRQPDRDLVPQRAHQAFTFAIAVGLVAAGRRRGHAARSRGRRRAPGRCPHRSAPARPNLPRSSRVDAIELNRSTWCAQARSALLSAHLLDEPSSFPSSCVHVREKVVLELLAPRGAPRVQLHLQSELSADHVDADARSRSAGQGVEPPRLAGSARPV